MSYLKGKNLKIDKKNNVIKCDIADSSITDYNDKYIYSTCEDLYNGITGLNDKIAMLYYDIICGNLHFESGKYKNITCTFDYFENFITEIKNARYNGQNCFKSGVLYSIYKKYEEDIKSWLTENVILHTDYNNNLYIVRVNKKSVSMNYGKDKAKRFNKNYVENKTCLLKNGFIIEEI